MQIWGYVIVAIGFLMFLGGFTKTDFAVYRILAARSRILWGDHVHSFYIIAGLMVLAFGVLVALGYIHR